VIVTSVDIVPGRADCTAARAPIAYITATAILGDLTALIPAIAFSNLRTRSTLCAPLALPLPWLATLPRLLSRLTTLSRLLSTLSRLLSTLSRLLSTLSRLLS
jgi:hypothetical protein